jgi:hypothetical protein
MIAYVWSGVDADGNQQSATTARPLTEAQLLGVALTYLDLGWTELSGVDENGTEVAGIQDLGGGHCEAWAVTA